MSKVINITHLTSAHPRYDIRIFIKMCSSLAKKENYAVSLVVADGKGNETKNGVNIFDVGAKTGGRFSRMTKTVKKVFKQAKALDSDIYHLHDPELMFIGLKLQKMGKKVIFDVHEDYPVNIYSKPWIPNFLKPLVSIIYSFIEKKCLSKYTAVISVTPQIIDRINKYASITEMITNYPILNEDLFSHNLNINSKNVVFAGSIAPLRMIHSFLDALEEFPSLNMLLAGSVNKNYLEILSQKKAWSRVDFKGRISYEEVISLYKESLFGIVIENYDKINYDNQGSLGVIKLFEYMMLGLPFIATDFTLHKEIIDKYKCAITVNPNNKDELVSAIKFILDNPEEAIAMGKRGQQAVREKYNWASQEILLFKLYEELGGK